MLASVLISASAAKTTSLPAQKEEKFAENDWATAAELLNELQRVPCLLKFSQPLLELLVAYARTPRTIANILKNPPVCSVVSSKDLRALGLRSSDFPVIKIAIVGPSYTGKSSLLKLYVKDTDPYTPSTLSYDLRMQTLRFNVSEYCQLQLWDVSGNSNYVSSVKGIIRDALGFLLVFRPSCEAKDHSTYGASDLRCADWLEIINHNAAPHASIMLLANNFQRDNEVLRQTGMKKVMAHELVQQKRLHCFESGPADKDLTIETAINALAFRCLDVYNTLDHDSD